MEPHTLAIAKLIKQAEHFIDHREWDEAAARCYQILALDPDNLNAQNKLTLIYLQRELVEDMRRAVSRLFDQIGRATSELQSHSESRMPSSA